MFFDIQHTNHSKERWKQRFSSFCMFDEWSSALRATKSQRKIINGNLKYGNNKLYIGSEYYISQNDIVFVCRISERHPTSVSLVTVFLFNDNKSKPINTNIKHRNFRHRKRIANEFKTA